MEPLPQLRGPRMDISVDLFISPQVSYQKRHAKPYSSIYVIVNWYTKQVHYFPYHDMQDAVGLTEILTMKLVLQGAGVL